MGVKSTVRLNMPVIKRLDGAAVLALELTADAIHTDLQQSQTMPYQTGNLQNESTFVDTSESKKGYVALVSNTPYARRLYFHPEYDFSTDENPNAGGEWYNPYLKGGEKEDFAQKTYAKLYRRAARL